ncbi:LCP family protein [Vacuolonema iberomarrocanum]|uniref:LCP family protein n=1 Tax=Vacuolonema iberomarrocanum TaxID=3454632 RepID=UPI0019DD5054|nr:LCP family protein [filamentous cyanobacterium LEGE 07170]
MTSAIAGAVLALSLASTPLLQSQLSPEEAAVFGQDDIAAGMFRLPQVTRPVNILVLGVKVLSSDVSNPPPEVQDLGYHALVNSFEGLSDTMLLVRFDPADQSLSVLSLPRDTRTYVEGLGTAKLNEANLYGGAALSATAIQELLGGVPIDRYVRINVQGVEKMVDALGGVNLYVPQDMEYTDESQHLYIDLQEGEQHLDGNEALQFLRFRYDAYGDIGRVQRQQTFMRAMVEQALSPNTLTRIPQILSVIQENVDTNLTVEELVALTSFASQIDRSEVQMLMLPGEFSGNGQYETSYWLPHLSSIDEMMAQYFLESGSDSAVVADASQLDVSDFGEYVDPSYVTIAVQDSTGDDGAMTTLLNQLDLQGFYQSYPDISITEPIGTTRIIAQRGNRNEAIAVQQALGVGEVLVQSTGNLDSDITIQIGSDWLQQQ